MTELYKILKESVGLVKSEIQSLSAKLKKKEYKAKTTIIREGSIAHKLYFIESGLLRTYHLLEGKEISTYFASDNQFISTYSSFISQTPSLEVLETIEDSTVYELSYQSLLELYKESLRFEKLGRILAEKNYLCVLDRTLTMQTKTAKDKYLDFIENYDPKIIQRTPQHMIASFLGITPESLSRIRKQVFIS